MATSLRSTTPPAAPGVPAPGGRPAPAASGSRCDCHYCGSALPRGRTVTFCPYCGQDVTIRQCPACSAELDLGWHFCVSCGRKADGAEPPPGGDAGG